LISVVILNWNGKECLYPCIRSVRAQSYPNTEILVVDNASTDGSLEEVRLFSDLRFVINAKNLGYGGGNNRGIEAARGKYIFVLNNDTEIEKECVEWLWKGMERDGTIGMATPKILLYDRRDTIDAAGLTIYPDGLSIGRGHSEPQAGYSQGEEVFSGSGCASLLRREMLDEIGLYDEDFFAYAEDTDLGWRARLAGWKACYVPEAIVYHHHSKKFGAYSEAKAFLVERNRIWVALKNFPLPLLCLVPLYTLIRYLYQAIALLRKRGASGRFGENASPLRVIPVVLRALMSGLAGVPWVLRKRRQIQEKRRSSTRECFRLFKKYGIKAKDIAYVE
jgi:GT2 family glycosyltransferase